MSGEIEAPSEITICSQPFGPMNAKTIKWELYKCPDSKLGKYTINELGIFLVQTLKSGEKKVQHISRTPLVLCGRTEPLEDGTVYYTVRYAVGGEQKEFVAPLSELLIKSSLKVLLTSHGINVTDGKMLDEVMEYISLCVFHYGFMLKKTVAVVSNGWNEDCTLFALGKNGITADGIHPIQTLVTTPEHIDPFHTSGSMTGWIKAVTPIMKYDVARFLFYDAMTAPLKKLLKIESHTFVHHGPTSRGKTAIENSISSTMGNPKPLEFIANSTKNAVLAHVSGMCDTPVNIEEATEERSRIAMVDAVYDIANGKEKGRCGIDGKLRTDIKTFRTTVHVTCENPLRDQMKNAGAAYRAQHIGDVLPEGLEEMVSTTKKEVQENYGHYFPRYIQHIIKNMDRVKELYNEAMLKINIDGIPKESQNIIGRSKHIYAGILTSGYLCEEVFKEIGLPYKEKAEVERIVNKYFQMCVINEPIEPDYIRALRVINDWIITDSRNFINKDKDFAYDKELKSNIYGEISEKYIDIVGSEFTKKMSDSGFTPTDIKKLLFNNKITVCTDKRQIGDYSVTVNKHKSSGIRIIRRAMEEKLGLGRLEDPELEYGTREMANRVLHMVKTLVKMKGEADPFILKQIFGDEVEDYLSILESKGKILRMPDGAYF